MYQSGSTCILFDHSQSFELDKAAVRMKSDSSGLQRYVSVKELFDDSYYFSEMPPNICVSGGKTIAQPPETVTTTYACGLRCSKDKECGMFTITEIPKFQCWLHYSGEISSECNSEEGKTLYSLYIESNKVVLSENSRSLPGENIIAQYNDVNVLDCVGICQKSQDCKSCSHDRGVCTITDDRESTYQEGTYKFRPVSQRCIETKEGKVFKKRDLSDCLTLCSKLNGIGKCDAFEHSIDGDCTIYIDEDSSCKSAFDDGSSNVYVYSRDAIARSAGSITVNDIDGEFTVFLSQDDGATSQTLLAQERLLNNEAETMTDRIVDVVELVDECAIMVGDIYSALNSVSSLLTIVQPIGSLISAGIQLFVQVSFQSDIYISAHVTKYKFLTF